MAIHHREIGLSDQTAVEIYRYMFMARKVDEREWILNRAGKIHFVISCQGQEAAQVGAAFALEKGVDYLNPYYRDTGVVLVMGMTVRDLLLSAFAKAEDPNSGGRQMPGHFSSRKLNIMTQSSPTGTQIPHAVGFALAAKYEKKPFVSFVTLGEGTSNQGDFHEALNFAGVHKLPVIVLVENNQYAISVPVKKQLACESVADRAVGYGMPGVSVDGNDPLEVYKAVKEARERALRGEGGTLIEAKTYRLTPHSSDDDDRTYRSRDEVELAKKQDPILRYREYILSQRLMDEGELAALEKKVMEEIDEATRYAEEAPYPEPESAMLHVYG
ncbi:branched-chain alpha-keto acid dehydrogenase E1 subunit [[Clostridium] ultunense Esp]|nr:branched-chain alpha-keto acid dehydrogenase E1 subunit [[Clostridium] ultunense Esp]